MLRALVAAETVTCVVQVDGRVRDRLTVSPDIDAETLESLALGAAHALQSLAGAAVAKVVVRPPKPVNIVSLRG